MPDHLISVHPVVRLSRLDSVQAALLEQDGDTEHMEQRGINNGQQDENTIDGTVLPYPVEIKKFVIDDNGKMGQSLLCSRNAGENYRNVKVKACAIRDPGCGAVSNPLRFK